MLRSSSVMNLEEDKKRGGFFEAFKSKGWSSRNLHAHVANDITNQPQRRQLTSSMSMNRLNQRLNPGLEQKNNYLSTVSKERREGENKENVMVMETKYNPMKSLKKRTSAPALQKTRTKTSSDKKVTGSRLKKSSTLVNFQDHILRNQPETIKIHESPETPDSMHTTDSLLDLASIRLIDFDNDEDLLLDESLEHQSASSKITDPSKITDYFRDNHLLHSNISNARESSDAENTEMYKCEWTFSQSEDFFSEIRFVQNAVFLSVASKAAVDEKQRYLDHLEGINYEDAFQDNDHDQSYDFNIYI